jgi:hypothetical protein
MKFKRFKYNGKKTDYHISNDGVFMGKHGKIMKPRYTPNGYMQACLRVDKKYIYLYVHRCVYETFVGSIPNGYTINHIDGDKCNNHVDNLEIMTRLDNNRHAWEHGLAYSHNPHAGSCIEERLEKIYSLDTIKLICKKLEDPILTYQDIAKEYDVPVALVARIASGHLWKNISSKFDIKNRLAKRRKIFEERDKLIRDMLAKGITCVDIAKALNMSPYAVYRRKYLMNKKCI